MAAINVELDLDAHLEALNHAEALGAQPVDPNLAGKAGLETLAQYVKPVWEEIRIAIESAVTTGESYVSETWEATQRALNEIAQSTGAAVSDLSELIRRRLSEYVKRVEEIMLANISGVISVGGINMALQSVDIQKTVKLSTSLKASLADALSLAAGGDLSVKANYSVPMT